jgi:hypothetical protein
VLDKSMEYPMDLRETEKALREKNELTPLRSFLAHLRE